MIVLGIDPGARWVGWAVLATDGARLHYVDAGVVDVDSDSSAVTRFDIKALANGCTVAGIERVEHVAPRARFGAGMARGLVEAAWAGGVISERLRALGLTVDTFPASAWRSHYFGRGSVDDKAVAALVSRFVVGWPARSNAHARDAAGVAMFAAQRAKVKAAAEPERIASLSLGPEGLRVDFEPAKPRRRS